MTSFMGFMTSRRRPINQAYLEDGSSTWKLHWTKCSPGSQNRLHVSAAKNSPIHALLLLIFEKEKKGLQGQPPAGPLPLFSAVRMIDVTVIQDTPQY